jgi:flavin reductase (DIM6/NTAB) family NADH-FMN oxidoreductase RutF
VILDSGQVPAAEIYHVMIGVIVPRAIAFVSTVGADGKFNAAPFSFYTGISSAPPLLGISINLRAGSPKDTLRNIRATGDFVVNAVTEDMLAQVVRASGDWPSSVDELALTGLTSEPSDRVRAPRVRESPVHLECRLHREIDLGGTLFVVGEIARIHVADSVLTDGRVDIRKLKPVGRLGGAQYARLGEILELPRPKVT